MIIRLEKKDISSIIALHKTCAFADGWNEKMLDSAFGNNYNAFGVAQKGELVAYIGFDAGLYEYEFQTVLVNPLFRKKGFAKALIGKMLDMAKENNIEGIFLEVRENNQSAINLYQGLGFKVIQKRNKYYFDGENALVMKKEI